MSMILSSVQLEVMLADLVVYAKHDAVVDPLIRRCGWTHLI